MCKCSWKQLKKKQEDDAVLDVVPKCDVPAAFVVRNVDALKDFKMCL